MFGRLFQVLSVAGVVALGSAEQAKADVLLLPPNGQGNSSECPPFGCATHYQQIYSVAPFGAATHRPMLITDLLFFNNANTSGLPAQIDQGIFTIRLAVTSAPSDGSVAAFVDIQSPVAVFTGQLPAGVPFRGLPLDIKAQHPFTYDPSLGQNLLLDITKESSSPTSGGMDVLMQANGLFGRIYEFPSGTISHDSGGLVTQFVFTPVPEPVAVVQLCAGLAVVALLVRPRRAVMGRRV